MVQGCGRFVWNHKAAAHGWIIRKWLFLLKALSAVCPRFVRGCPRLSRLHWCLSAVVRSMACFLAILLSADVRGWILNVKSYQYWDLVVRGCPRPPGSPTSCRKAVVRGRYGFLLGFDFFLGVSIDCNMYIFSAALFELLCLFLFVTAAFQSSHGWLQTNNSVACVPLQQVVSSASALYIRTVEEPNNKTVSLLLG